MAIPVTSKCFHPNISAVSRRERHEPEGRYKDTAEGLTLTSMGFAGLGMLFPAAGIDAGERRGHKQSLSFLDRRQSQPFTSLSFPVPGKGPPKAPAPRFLPRSPLVNFPEPCFPGRIVGSV